KELHAQILIDLRFAFGLRQPTHGVDVVRLHAIEVVLGLRVLRAEDRIGVGFSVNVRNAPVITDDRDIGRFLLPARDVRGLSSCGKTGGYGSEQNNDGQNEGGARSYERFPVHEQLPSWVRSMR